MNTTIELKDIYQGESTYPTFQYKENGVAVKLSDLENIRVLYKDDKTGDIFSKYSMIPIDGWDSDNFIVIDDLTGIFGIKIQQSETAKWKCQIVTIEIEVKKSIDGFSPEYKTILAERVYNVLNSKIAKQ